MTSETVWVIIVFLSTLSLRRATLGAGKSCNVCRISIHALLAESDQTQRLKIAAHGDFYPRSPCGERRYGQQYWKR